MPTRTPDGLITLSADELRQFAVAALLQHVQLHINGAKCALETVYELIWKAVGALRRGDGLGAFQATLRVWPPSCWPAAEPAPLNLVANDAPPDSRD